MKITKIIPRRDVPNYQFSVELQDGTWTSTLKVKAEQLLSYQLFTQEVLAKTGRIYGDGAFLNWNEVIRKHLNEFWKDGKT